MFVDSHNAWNSFNNTYTIPVTCTYVISMKSCVGATQDQMVRVNIAYNKYFLLFESFGSHQGEDTIGRTHVTSKLKKARA